MSSAGPRLYPGEDDLSGNKQAFRGPEDPGPTSGGHEALPGRGVLGGSQDCDNGSMSDGEPRLYGGVDTSSADLDTGRADVDTGISASGVDVDASPEGALPVSLNGRRQTAPEDLPPLPPLSTTVPVTNVTAPDVAPAPDPSQGKESNRWNLLKRLK